MKVSVIIPFKNEEEYAAITVDKVHGFLEAKGVDFELIVVDDSDDGTWDILKDYERGHPRVVVVKGGKPAGYGKAIRRGYQTATGEILVPFNGDLCDSLDDLLLYVRTIEEGYDMAFGSRYMKGGRIIDYPAGKALFSRAGNLFLKILFRSDCSDLTNTFKAYRRHVIEKVLPQANSYEIGLEVALRGIREGFSYKTIPISWTGRAHGVSKMVVPFSIVRHLGMAFKIRFGL